MLDIISPILHELALVQRDYCKINRRDLLTESTRSGRDPYICSSPGRVRQRRRNGEDRLLLLPLRVHSLANAAPAARVRFQYISCDMLRRDARARSIKRRFGTTQLNVDVEPCNCCRMNCRDY